MEKIGLDVDGVLRNLMDEINKVFRRPYPEHITDEPAYTYDFPHIRMPLKDKFDIIFNKYPKDIFLKAKPYQNTISQFKLLKKWAAQNNMILACATSQEPHLIPFTFSWLGKYNLVFDEVYITKDKGNIGLDYLIDDAPYNYENWLKNGNPEQNFFLMSREWNQETKATNRIKELADIIKIIK